MRESDMEHAFNVWEQFFLEKEKKKQRPGFAPSAVWGRNQNL